MSANASNPTPVVPQLRPVRRVVTGHDANGRSVILYDTVSPHVECVMGIPTLGPTELWATCETPARNTGSPDPVTLPVKIAPPERGSVFRVVEFPPDKDWQGRIRPGASLTEAPGNGSDPMMHRTRSLDYVVVMSGEIWAVMDEGEALLRAGDVMVQRGTNHAWSNRSDAPCVIAFVLIDAEPIAGLDTH